MAKVELTDHEAAVVASLRATPEERIAEHRVEMEARRKALPPEAQAEMAALELLAPSDRRVLHMERTRRRMNEVLDTPAGQAALARLRAAGLID